MISKRLRAISVLLLGAVLFTGTAAEMALADSPDNPIGVWGIPYKPGWTYRLGGLAMLLPAYEGSKKYFVLPLPSLEIDYNDRLYANDFSATYALFQNKWISIGPELTLYLGRYRSYDHTLDGLSDLPTDVKGGAFVGFHSPVGSLVVEGSRSLGTSVGSTGSISFQSGYLFDPKRLILNVTPGVTWADRSYMQNNFGITQSQSVTSGYTVYTPTSGFYNYFIQIAPEFIISTHHYIIPTFMYTRLFGDAKGSPLVTGPGAPNEFVGILSYQYQF